MSVLIYQILLRQHASNLEPIAIMSPILAIHAQYIVPKHCMMSEYTSYCPRISSGIFVINYLNAILAMFIYVVSTVNLDDSFQKQSLSLACSNSGTPEILDSNSFLLHSCKMFMSHPSPSN